MNNSGGGTVAKIFGLAALVVSGVVIADIWIHPKGTQAAGSAVNAISTPAYSALLGQSPKAA